MSNPIYKNALRSKKMIKDAFLELVSQKNISKIKVKEMIEVANISKGTFYAHYEDIYEVLEEIENENIENIIGYLSEIKIEMLIDDFSPFINKLFDYVDENKNVYIKLFGSNVGFDFLSKMQKVFVDYMMQDKEMLSHLKDETTARHFFSFIAVGTASLMYEYYTTEKSYPLQDIKETLNNSILYGISAIKIK